MPSSEPTHLVILEPDGARVHVRDGSTILAAAQAAGIAINTPCGGTGTCGNCRVEVVRGRCKPNDNECEVLSEKEIARGVRLACQACATGNLTVVIPKKTRAFDQKILVDGLGHPVALAPNVRRIPLRMEAPSIEDQRSDTDRIIDAVAAAGAGSCSLGISHLRNLPAILRESDLHVAAVVAGDRITGIERLDSSPGAFGAAFDIGTTTVVGMLLDLATGNQAAVASRTNPQVAYGDDVVSRINHASQSLANRQELSARIVACINEILQELAQKAGVKVTDIYEVVLAGNTSMNHLLLGIDPTYVAQAPYVAALRSGLEVSPGDLGIAVSSHANVYLLPNIAGFVGGDTVGVILAADIAHEKAVHMAIDIGTNGELVLGNRDRMLCASCAAGPAFEGARIQFGMRAAPGAIERVDDDDDVRLKTIGNEPPHGICGSGIIDAIARMFDLGLIEPTGAIVEDPSSLKVSDAIKTRLRLIDGQPVFYLARPEESALDTGIYITQRDVREVQLAKGAIAAGFTILLKEMGITADEIDQVDVAGAFGNYIRAGSALSVGLLPSVPRDKIRFIGNGAGVGARMCLLNADLREDAERVSKNVRYVELAGRPDFQMVFAEAMMFG